MPRRLALALLLLVGWGPGTVQAAVHTVEKCDGHPDGADAAAGGLSGQLRRLINDAQPGDLILVPDGCTITLVPDGPEPGDDDANQDGDLDLARDVTIQGAGPGRSIVDGGRGGSNVFRIESPAVVSLSGLTIRGADERGVRHVSSGLLTVTHAVIEENERGGIVGFSGPMVLSHVTVRNNRGSGIDIDTVLSTVVLTNVTVSGNTTTGSGGGIRASSGAVLLNHVTIAGNRADTDDAGPGVGGGLLSQTFEGLTLRNSIIAGNTRGSARVPDDCAVPLSLFVSLGSNLVQTADGCTGLRAADVTGVDPLLGPLSSNGGSTPTHALLPGSPAIDAGDGGCAAVDQRGIARPQGPRCDIGAFEAGAGSGGAFPDFDGDGGADVVVAGGGGEVRVLSGLTGTLLLALTPFGPGYQGPLSLAVCDLTGDGRPDVVVGGVGPDGPEVRAVDGTTGAPLPGPLGALPVFDPLALGPGRGVLLGTPAVGCADVDGDGTPDLVAGAPAGTAPGVVRVFSGRDGALLQEVEAFDPPGPGPLAIGP